MADPFIDRIKDKGQQAKSLLSPWLRTSGTQGSEGGGQLPLNERLHLAASKMRVLDDRKLGNAHPERMRTFGAEITKKLQSIQDLVHFSPKIERDPSIWSQMDRVYPASIGEAPREPEQPGVMRAGTVIQKFSMTPKPGQSIESFKDQAARISQPKPSAARPQKPALPSRARLYSRVQEITAKEKEPQSRIDDVEVPPNVPSLPELLSQETIEQASELTMPTDPPKSDLIEQAQNVETQKSSTEERETKPVVQDEVPPAKPLTTLPDLLPISPAELPLQSPAPARTPSSEPKTRLKSPAEKPSLPDAASASERTPIVQETAAGDPPAEKRAEPLKQARPVKKYEEPAASAPRPRATVAPALPASDKPSKPASSSPSQTVQRQPDGSVLPRTPLAARQSTDRPIPRGPSQTEQSQPESLLSAKPVDPIQPKGDQQPFMPPIVSSKRIAAAIPVRQPDEDDIPAGQEVARSEAALPLPLQTISPPAQPDGPPIELAFQQPQEVSPVFDAGISEPAAEQDHQSLPSKPAMPLHTRLIERKSAARSIKPAVPDALRHVQARRLVSTQPPLISERKYRFDTPKADAPPSKISHPQSKPADPVLPAVAGNQAVIQRMSETVQAQDQPDHSTNPMTMVLADGQSTPARTTARVPSVSQTPPSQAALIPANVQKDSSQKPAEAGGVNPSRKKSEARIRPLKTKPGGVVQRRWEEHSDPQSGSSSGSDRAQEAEQQPVDLDRLANDIFPLVKRLLEIELERSSGSF